VLDTVDVFELQSCVWEYWEYSGALRDCSPMECREGSATAAVTEVGLLIHSITDMLPTGYFSKRDNEMYQKTEDL